MDPGEEAEGRRMSVCACSGTAELCSVALGRSF